jgi:L-fuconate dehydratase
MPDRFTEACSPTCVFPTSRLGRLGRDESCPAYPELRTSGSESGFGFILTIGRGNEVRVAAIRALELRLLGREVNEVLADLGGISRELSGNSCTGWGPEKGVQHMAVGAVVNALWDLRARASVPLRRLLHDLSPAEIVNLVDIRYIEDASPPRKRARSWSRDGPVPSSANGSCGNSEYPRTRPQPGGSGIPTRRSSDSARSRWQRGSTI